MCVMVEIEKALYLICDTYDLSYMLMDDPDPKHWLIRFKLGDKVCYRLVNKFIFSRYNNVGKELYLYEIILPVIKMLEDES